MTTEQNEPRPTMLKEDLAKFGDETVLGRPGQPEALAPAYVYFASQDGSYATGSLLEATGGPARGPGGSAQKNSFVDTMRPGAAGVDG